MLPKKPRSNEGIPLSKIYGVDTISYDSRLETKIERPASIEDLKEVHIRHWCYQVTKLNTSLSKSDEEDMTALLRSIDMFA